MYVQEGIKRSRCPDICNLHKEQSLQFYFLKKIYCERLRESVHTQVRVPECVKGEEQREWERENPKQTSY